MVAEPKRVAAVITEYCENSLSDKILGRILEGYNYLGKERPELKLVTLYADRFPENEWSRALARKHEVLIHDTIEFALTRNSEALAIDGILIIGADGEYPVNELGERLCPQRQLFDQVSATFEKKGSVVPVFHAGRLGSSWEDASWMVGRSRELHFPLLVGSELPLTWRRPQLVLPWGCRIAEVVVVASGDFDPCAYHALELLQCMVERRRGGESGVRLVRLLQGHDVWKVADPPFRLLNAAISCGPRIRGDSPEHACAETAKALVIEYCDGLRATVLLLDNYVEHYGFAARLRGLYRGPGISGTTASCQFYLQEHRPFAQFDLLVKAIDQFVGSTHAVFPLERAMIISGVLEAARKSHLERNRPVITPHLAKFRYEPIPCEFASGPIPS